MSGDVPVLLGRPFLVFGPRHPILVDLLVGDEERRSSQTCLYLGLVVEVAELGLGDSWHVFHDPGAHLGLRWVHRHRTGFR